MDDTFLKAFGIERGCVFIQGAGGKTSLIRRLAHEGRDRGQSVLVTSTTRMYMPEYADYSDFEGGYFKGVEINNGIYSACDDYNNGKISCRNLDVIKELKARFDLILIESDGAAGKRLKGWKHYEPVVTSDGDFTIGVVDYLTIGMEADESFIHRFDIFQEITGVKQGEKIDFSHIESVIEHDNGLFREFSGERIVYFSKCDVKPEIKADICVYFGDVFKGQVERL